MIPVTITVTVGRKKVPIDSMPDMRIQRAFREAGNNVGKTLSNVKCPEHGKAPWNVRVHFEANGDADLKYESCCDKLVKQVQASLG